MNEIKDCFVTVDQYLDIIMDAGKKAYECEECDSEHGTCIPPGMCACKRGWMGNSCTEGTPVTHTHYCYSTCVMHNTK